MNKETEPLFEEEPLSALALGQLRAYVKFLRPSHLREYGLVPIDPWIREVRSLSYLSFWATEFPTNNNLLKNLIGKLNPVDQFSLRAIWIASGADLTAFGTPYLHALVPQSSDGMFFDLEKCSWVLHQVRVAEAVYSPWKVEKRDLMRGYVQVNAHDTKNINQLCEQVLEGAEPLNTLRSLSQDAAWDCSWEREQLLKKNKVV